MKVPAFGVAPHRPFFAASMALALAIARPADAQTYDQLAPKPVRDASPPAAAQPAPAVPNSPGDSNEVLVPSLAGVRLVSYTSRASSTPLGAGVSVLVEDLPWLDRRKVEALAGDFLSRPLTKGGL